MKIIDYVVLNISFSCTESSEVVTYPCRLKMVSFSKIHPDIPTFQELLEIENKSQSWDHLENFATNIFLGVETPEPLELFGQQLTTPEAKKTIILMNVAMLTALYRFYVGSYLGGKALVASIQAAVKV